MLYIAYFQERFGLCLRASLAVFYRCWRRAFTFSDNLASLSAFSLPSREYINMSWDPVQLHQIKLWEFNEWVISLLNKFGRNVYDWLSPQILIRFPDRLLIVGISVQFRIYIISVWKTGLFVFLTKVLREYTCSHILLPIFDRFVMIKVTSGGCSEHPSCSWKLFWELQPHNPYRSDIVIWFVLTPDDSAVSKESRHETSVSQAQGDFPCHILAVEMRKIERCQHCPRWDPGIGYTWHSLIRLFSLYRSAFPTNAASFNYRKFCNICRYFAVFFGCLIEV